MLRDFLDRFRPAGPDALSAGDRSALAFEAAFLRDFVSQRRDAARSLDETLDRAWRALRVLPRAELTMLSTRLLDAHYGDDHG